MAEPIVFISRNRIKPGKLDAFRRYFREGSGALEATKPNTVFFRAYLAEDGTAVSFVHVFPDAAAMDLHFEGADERSSGAYEYIEPVGFEIYGRPSDAVLESMKRQAAEGLDLTVRPLDLGGFIRIVSA